MASSDQEQSTVASLRDLSVEDLRTTKRVLETLGYKRTIEPDRELHEDETRYRAIFEAELMRTIDARTKQKRQALDDEED